jgi:RNA polymerase sigma-70 factor (ECF subfamily)
MAVLAPEVTLVSDGGGLTGAPRRPVHGSRLVARAFVVLSRQLPADAVAEVLEINGGPGIVVRGGGRPVLAVTLHLVDGVVETVHVVSNPHKLSGVVV